MFHILHQRYADHIDQIERLMTEEIAYWDWDDIPQMKALVMRYLARSGKRLRPLLGLLFAELYGGRLEAIYWPAAAIETYHTDTLVYDDIQDNSEFRRGLPCAHVTASTSTAMNLAAVTRSFMYHFVHRSPHLNATQKVEVHQMLDHASTLVTLGQSIDIGWHEGWYSTYQCFPYERMIRWKSASLFGCIAAVGTMLSCTDPNAVRQAKEIGIEIGLLFQMVDDYLDIFGDPKVMFRPLFTDFCEGKVTYPVICLFNRLTSCDKVEVVNHVLQRLGQRDAHQENWKWLVDLMLDFGIDECLQNQFQEKVEQLTCAIGKIAGNTQAQESLNMFVDTLVSPVNSGQRA